MTNNEANVSKTANATYSLSGIRTKMVLAAITFCMFVLGFSMFKLLPMQTAIMRYFKIEVSAYGYLNTAQNWFVIIFTVPFGFLIRKLPCKWSMFLSFVLLFAGSLLQVFTSNYILFVIGRMLEGGGYGFMALIGHSLTANLVSPKRIGFWVSFMVTVGMLGQVIHTRVASFMMLEKGMSFQSVFLAIIILQAVCFVFWMAVVPGSVRVTGRANDAKPTREQTMRIYRNRSCWYVSLALAFFNMAVVSFSAYVIHYLIMRGMAPGAAATTYSYTSLLGIVSMLVFGWLSDRLKTKRKLAVLSFFSGIVALVLLVKLPIEAIMIYVLVFGTLPRSVAGMSSACAPDLVELPADVPVFNSFKNTVSQLLGVFGGILTGYLLQFIGYDYTIYFLCVMMGIGGLLWVFAKEIP